MRASSSGARASPSPHRSSQPDRPARENSTFFFCPAYDFSPVKRRRAALWTGRSSYPPWSRLMLVPKVVCEQYTRQRESLGSRGPERESVY